jgi:sugar lactone lactonase YvrE
MKQLAAVVVTCVIVLVPGLDARARQTQAVSNDLPQPYRTTRDWGELPPGVKWAAVTAIEPAPDGTLYVVHRCFANSCAGRTEAPILKYDRNGKLLATFGLFPHGGTVDREGNLWITDAGGADGKGHVALKFSPSGGVLMTLGKPGVSGSGPTLFDQPTDVVVAPSGDIFVSDSHRNGKNNRIVRFTKDGKFVKEWGRKGAGRGELSEPHTIAMDSRGRLFVGDRENNRIQIFDQDGTLLDEWRQFGRPSGIVITRDDTIYVAYSESGGPIPARTSFRGSRRAYASAAHATDRSPRSSRTWNRWRSSMLTPRASASTRMAMCMAASSGVRCWSATSRSKGVAPRSHSLARLLGVPGLASGTRLSSRTTNVPPTMTWRMPTEYCAGCS